MKQIFSGGFKTEDGQWNSSGEIDISNFKKIRIATRISNSGQQHNCIVFTRVSIAGTEGLAPLVLGTIVRAVGNPHDSGLDPDGGSLVLDSPLPDSIWIGVRDNGNHNKNGTGLQFAVWGVPRDTV